MNNRQSRRARVGELTKDEEMPLVNYPEFQVESVKTGPKHSIIRVKNLSSNARVGVDVWGRTEEGKVNKFQPVQVSVGIALKTPFETAASSDSVDGSTVHYGTLSKAIMQVLAFRGEERRPCDEAEKMVVVGCIEQDWTLAFLLEAICFWLTRQSFGDDDIYQKLRGFTPVALKRALSCPSSPSKAIVSMDSVNELEFSCFLPKGSILGTGVSLRVLTIPLPRPGIESATFCSVLKLHDIRIPTLIGVNSNERLAKQMVIANIEIDGYSLYHMDLYHKLEQIVVKTIEESSFDTLESLGTHLVRRIIKWFLYAEFRTFVKPPNEDPEVQFGQLVIVSLEKPSAVMFAESPAVEVRRHADPRHSRELLNQIFESSKRNHVDMVAGGIVPFPLQGRLDDWIRETDPFDTT